MRFSVTRRFHRRSLIVSAVVAAVLVPLVISGGTFAVSNHSAIAAGAASDHEEQGNKVTHDLAALAGQSQGFSLQHEPRQYDGEYTQSFSGATIYDGWVVINAIAAGDPTVLLVDLEALGLLQGTAIGGRGSRPAYMATDVGAVTSQGDAAMRSDVARTTFGLDGSGVTVGVLSDSYDCLGGAAADVASGDLPAGVVVLQEHPACSFGTDEGRAMMQIVRDVAPGAAQIFNTASNGQAALAQAILNLRDAGADVIVDDVIYFGEPMFQDGVIAQAVDTVEGDRVAYFSSSGNDGRKSYESAFTPGNTFSAGAFGQGTGFAPPFMGGIAHDFGGGDVFQQVTLPADNTIKISFQWADPAASVCSGCPGAGTEMDVYILDNPPTVVLNGGAAVNVDGDPVEIVSLNRSAGTGTGIVNVKLVKRSGPAPSLMKYVRFGTSGVTFDQFNTDSGTVFGHNNAAGAEAVGAAFYFQTPEFGQTPPLLEPFSSPGPNADLVRYRRQLHQPDYPQ